MNVGIRLACNAIVSPTKCCHVIEAEAEDLYLHKLFYLIPRNALLSNIQAISCFKGIYALIEVLTKTTSDITTSWKN